MTEEMEKDLVSPLKKKNKGYSKKKKVKCFNRGRLGYVSSNSLSPKGIKKSMQTTQSNITPMRVTP